MKIQTQRLILRELITEDAPFILKLLNDASFLRYIGDRGVHSIEQASEYIQKSAIQSYRKNKYGLYLVSLQTSLTPVGICGLVKREIFSAPDIGFAFLSEFQSRGYAFESADAVCKEARPRLGLKQILGITSGDNPGSVRVLQKLGLRYVKMITLHYGQSEAQLFATLPDKFK